MSKADILAIEPILRRADDAAADHRLSLAELSPGNQTHSSASRTRHHSYVWILRMTQLRLVLQKENRSGVHFVGDPLFKKLQVAGHPALRESDVTKQVPFVSVRPTAPT